MANRTGWQRREARRALLGVLASACLVLQPFLVSLHMALFEHELFEEPTGHVHSQASAGHGHHDHGGPGHTHEQAPEGAADDGHEPHPFEDHFERLSEPALRPTPGHLVLAPAPAPAGSLVFDLPSPERPRVEARGPRRPPPRRAAVPRAPPVLV